MSYLDDSCDCVREAFETDKIGTALIAFQKGLWNPTETQGELRDLVAEVGDALRADGDVEESDFCRDLLKRLEGAKDGQMELAWFLTETLRVTGWAKPSPTRAVEDHLKGIRDLAVLAEACQRVIASRGEARLRAYVREAESERRWEKARRIGMAVGTLGLSLAFEDAL